MIWASSARAAALDGNGDADSTHDSNGSSVLVCGPSFRIGTDATPTAANGSYMKHGYTD